MSTTKQIANESELRFASEFVRKGWSVFLPYGEDSPVDILIYKDEQFKKIQVKATKPKNGVISCYLRSANNWQNKKYSSKDVDYFAVYDYENKQGYLIPLEKVEGMSQIKLRLIATKNNQLKGIRMAKDYEYFNH
tara:strand:- start:371 stop:775 length:405 start_codon:yes stop_codon:yes gene_type:complete